MPGLKSLVAKLDVQHFLLVLVFAVSVILPDAVKLENALGLGQLVPVTVKVLSCATFVLGLLKQFQPTPESVLAQASKLASRGFVRWPLLAGVGFSGSAIAGLLIACGLTGQQVQTGGRVAIGAIDIAICVLNHEKDPPLQIATECGSSLEQAVDVLTAHRAAMIREGYVLRPIDAGAE